ncbi:MAG: thioredoxin family protein [Gammaproteobacteria bacterium]|nr:thioredoxin family protein [Gammaproteobacteria bacterium]
MARTPSNMIEIGTAAPNFNLINPLTQQTVSLEQYQGKPLLVVFSCNHCPYVLHILESFVEYSNEFIAKGLEIVMINSNDVENYADDSPEKMVELCQTYGFKFSYLYDEDQSAAMAYKAACTPDFFLFNEQHNLVYRGQYDSARPRNDDPITGDDLRQATHALLNNEAISEKQLPSLGCNVKWKAGNEPDAS